MAAEDAVLVQLGPISNMYIYNACMYRRGCRRGSGAGEGVERRHDVQRRDELLGLDRCVCVCVCVCT